MKPEPRDHGGGIDAARARFGGNRADWIDLSTGINPHPYPVGAFSPDAWTALPDRGAFQALEQAARDFWQVPDDLAILPAPGASALIARIPSLWPVGRVAIPGPTYNEHAASFVAAGWQVTERGDEAQVIVHPNNPTGHHWSAADLTARYRVIDESFCDVTPDQTLLDQAMHPGTIVLKSFGKFWGLAGARLGFAIGHPETLAPLRDALGPWQVSGPTLDIATKALRDQNWATDTRTRLTQDADRLDQLMQPHGALVGGTTLFRLYETDNAAAFQTKLAKHQIWSRIFPYSDTWVRLGLPHETQWDRLTETLSAQ